MTDKTNDQVEHLLSNFSHEQLGEAFGRSATDALKSAGVYSDFTAMVQAITSGARPQEETDFDRARDWANSSVELNGAGNQAVGMRVHKFLDSVEWEMEPGCELAASIWSVETHEFVATVDYYEDAVFLNRELGVMFEIGRGPRGFTLAIYAEKPMSTNERVRLAREMLVEPDPFEGRIVAMQADGNLRVLEPAELEVQPPPVEVQKAVEWLSSLADESVREELQSLAMPTRAGLLLDGPPGSGKTTLARSLATEMSNAGVTVIYPAASVPPTTVFELVASYSPVLVVLEDVESFIGRRGHSNFSEFLNEVDGLDSGAGVMILATTNDSSKLDPAVRRPGRIERRAVLSTIHADASVIMLRERIPGIADSTLELVLSLINEKVKVVTPAVIDSVARARVMLRADERRLLEYLEHEWEPNYEGVSYID